MEDDEDFRVIAESLRRHRAWWLILVMGLAGAVLLSRSNYLLFHTLVEMFTVVVGFIIGVVAWHTFRFSRNYMLAFLGAAYPAVATVDLLHTLAYSGMGVFADGANLPTELWIAARGLEATALLMAPAFLTRPFRIGYAFAGFAGATIGLLLLIFTGWFPDMYVEGQGLTPLKVGAEYLIVGLLAGAFLRLWNRRGHMDRQVLGMMAVVLVLTALSELAFTFYVGVYDLSNMVGHLAKMASFWLVFLALAHTSLREPFRLLSRQSTTYDAIPEEIVVVDTEGRIRQVNRVVAERYGERAVVGSDCHQLFHPRNLSRENCPACQAIARGEEVATMELHHPDRDAWCLLTLAPIRDPLQPRGMVHVQKDITAQKRSAVELERVNRALRAISASNHALLHIDDEQELLGAVCRLVVEKGSYRMAWVGYPDEGPDRSILPQASAGDEDDFLKAVRFSWGDNPLGQGPAGRALRTGKAVIANVIATEPTYDPWREEALHRGFFATMALPLRVRGEPPFGVLVIYADTPDVFTKQEVAVLAELAGDLAFGIWAARSGEKRELAEEKATHWYHKLAGALKETVEAISATVEIRDPYTAGHQRRVAELGAAIGRKLNLEPHRLEGLYMGGLIHDIGKLQVPSEILTRPGRLSELEFNMIQIHPQAGHDIVKDVSFPWPVADMILQHHERLDGSGYPQGLRGDQILLESRILAIADVVEAMASHRPYRAGLGIEAALAEIEDNAGVLYDREAVAACASLFREEGFQWDGWGMPAESGRASKA